MIILNDIAGVLFAICWGLIALASINGSGKPCNNNSNDNNNNNNNNNNDNDYYDIDFNHNNNIDNDFNDNNNNNDNENNDYLIISGHDPGGQILQWTWDR